MPRECKIVLDSLWLTLEGIREIKKKHSVAVHEEAETQLCNKRHLS